MQLNSYARLRDNINTGDLIAIRATSGLFPRLTRLVTRSPYTHTAIAVWVNSRDGTRRLLVAESNAAGASLAPLSNYANVGCDVFRSPVDRSRVERTLWGLLGTKVHYDVPDLARIAAHRLLGVPLPERDDGELICSALSATIYLTAGWQPPAPLPSIPAPADVAAAFPHCFIQYRPGEA